MVELNVQLYGTDVGAIRGDWRTFDFQASDGALSRFGLDSQILSVALPLAPVSVRAHRARRQNFFRELLPEGQMLQSLASMAGLPTHDVVGLLRRFGRDVAGALQIWDPEMPGEPREPDLERLDQVGVAHLLRDVVRTPLGNKPSGGKTSLAGVQEKIVLARVDDEWCRVLDGYPSSHILKPESRDYPTVIYDEEYGARLAQAVGLADFATTIEDFGGVPALVVERYDRSSQVPGGRVHQEDFNQILGVTGNEKYQRYGGKVTLERIAAVLHQVAETDARERLLRMVTLAAAVGNLDLHAKNLSLLHRPDGVMTLAPAYDVVPQSHQPNDGEMALAVAGEYRHAALDLGHLTREGERWGLASAEDAATDVLRLVREAVGREDPHPGADARLVDDIDRFTTNLLEGRATGVTKRDR